MGMTIEDCIKELLINKEDDTYVMGNETIDFAIDTMRKYKQLRTDHETRLKADMAAMLTEILLELDEMKITKVRSAGFAPYSKDPFRRGKEIIQQKIDKLKAGSEDEE